MKDLIPVLVGAGRFIAFIVVYGLSAAWVAGDAQKRGYSGVVPLLWLCSGGPLSALIWLFLRPHTTLVERPWHHYANADDAIAAASKLDMLGDWDEAIVLYQYAATQWPEHAGYVKECMVLSNPS